MVNCIAVFLLRRPVVTGAFLKKLRRVFFPRDSKIAEAIMIIEPENIFRFDILMNNSVIMYPNKSIAKVNTDSKDLFNIF